MSATVEDSRARPGAHRRRALLTARASLRDPCTRVVWTAFWSSRALIWAAGSVAFIAFGVKASHRNLFDPFHTTTSLGTVGNVLAAPAARWDSVWYLAISHVGYPNLHSTGFFPLYPLAIHVVSWVTISDVLAGVLISLMATAIGLVIVHRLTALELGGEAANRTVMLLAFAPFAFYLSAVYTEAVFLALTAGTFYAARRGRWAIAGILGGLASLSRVTGVLLFVPVVLMFLYGPRADADPRRMLAGRGSGGLLARLAPRYAVTPRLLWSLLIPAGLAAFCAYTALKGFGALATFNAQHTYWAHQFTGPLAGIWHGLTAGWRQLKQILSGNTSASARGPELLEACVLVICALGIVGVLRRLPPAYGVYVLLGLLIPLSSPTHGIEPLKGLDRYASMMFPLFMWAGAWSATRRRWHWIMAISVVLLIGFTVQFATWRFVGTNPI